MEDRRSGAVGRLRIGDFVRGLEDVGVYLVLWLLIAPSFLPSFIWMFARCCHYSNVYVCSCVQKANYRVSMRPSRSETWSVKQQQQQMATSKNRIDQWRREEWADRSFKVLGVEIGHLPASQQFLVCAGGVFSFLIVYGYMQVRREAKRPSQFELKSANK